MIDVPENPQPSPLGLYVGSTARISWRASALKGELADIVGTVIDLDEELVSVRPADRTLGSQKDINLDRVHAVEIIREGALGAAARRRASALLTRAGHQISRGFFNAAMTDVRHAMELVPDFAAEVAQTVGPGPDAPLVARVAGVEWVWRRDEAAG